MLKTIDGGTTWTFCPKVTTSSLIKIYFSDANNGYALDCTGDIGTPSGGHILRTTNAGNSWYIIESGTDKCLNSIHFTNASKGYIFGEGGNILKTTDGGVTWSFIKWNKK